jgi:hypothetical protein
MPTNTRNSVLMDLFGIKAVPDSPTFGLLEGVTEGSLIAIALEAELPRDAIPAHSQLLTAAVETASRSSFLLRAPGRGQLR